MPLDKKFRVLIRPFESYKYSHLASFRDDEEVEIWFDGEDYHIDENDNSDCWSPVAGGIFMRGNGEHGFVLLDFLDGNNPADDD